MGALLLLSVRPVRHHAYEIFIKLHYGLVLCSVVFTWFHVIQYTTGLPSRDKPGFSFICLGVLSALFAGTTLWQVGRILYYNFVPGKPLPTITIHKWQLHDGKAPPDTFKACVLLPRGWRVFAGQTIYIYIRTMKFWSLTQGHPLSIAWWQKPTGKIATHRALDENALQDLRNMGQDWNSLSKTSPGKSDSEVINDDNDPFTIWLLVRPEWGLTHDLAAYSSSTQLLAIVDGPYGGHMRLKQYGHVVMFAQGIGITAQMSYLRTFFYGSLAGELPTRRISVIWETQESKKHAIRNIWWANIFH